MADKKYSVDDILKIFNKLNKRIDELQCFVKECCAKIPVNVGIGLGLFKKLNQNKWEFKSLLAGSGVTLSETNNEIIISSTAPTVDCEDIDNCLGISPGGDPNKYLNEQGNWQTIVVPPDFIESVSDTATINLTVTGTDLTADFASMNISQFTNNSGYLNQTAADLLYYPLTNPSNFISLTSLSGGTGISYNNLTGVITNSAPDQTVVLSNGTAISVTGTYPNFTIANTAPDQIVTIGTTGSGLAVTGTYPNFTLQNTLPDQTVVLTQGGTTTITGTYPNFTISSADQFTGTVTSVAALTLGTTGTDLSSTVANGTTTPVITLNVPTASAANRGALSSTDWSTFNNKVSSVSAGTNISITGTATAPIVNVINTPRILLSDSGTYSVTGTVAETIVKTLLIPANTFSNGIIIFDFLTTRVTGTAGTIWPLVRVSTNAAVLGTLMLRGIAMTTAQYWQRENRSMAYKSATATLTYQTAIQVATEFLSAIHVPTSSNINWTVDQYFQFTITNGSAADTSAIQWITITHYP